MPIRFGEAKSARDDRKILGELKKSFDCGDILALYQTLRYCKLKRIPMADWAIVHHESLLTEILQHKKFGSPGRGNGPFGSYRKMLVKTVRASAYYYVKEWHLDPHSYRMMPRQTILKWYARPSLWKEKAYLKALRHTNDGLKGTGFQGQSQTMRKAAIGMLPPVKWGRIEVEKEFGLRGEHGFFGPPRGPVPKSIRAILDEHDHDQRDAR